MSSKKQYKTKFEKIYKTQIEQFRCQLMLVISSDMEFTTKKLGLDPVYAERMGYVMEADGDCVMVLSEDCIDPGLVSHESSHVAFAMMKFAGQPVELGEETFCYLLQNIVDFVWAKAKIK
jgi:hypothetical protein